VAALLLAATAATAVMLLKSSAGDAPKAPAKIKVLRRLDEFTKNAGPKVRNAIPAFLSIPGRIGVLEPNEDDAGAVPVIRHIKEISEVELAKGICSPSVPVLIRSLYPGAYDNWPDAKLERTVLAKHPEYRDKLCILPLWIEATPHDIVKYELTPRTPAEGASP